MKILVELRKDRHLTQKEVAKAIGISQSVYSYYENGRAEPTANVIKKLCIFYQVSADYLLGLELLDGRKIYNITNNFY